jgi:hypothetical protein
MISALGSHRFNPQTGLWELVTLENAAGVEISLPAVAEVGGLGADGPATALPVEPVQPDVLVAPETIIVCNPPIGPERVTQEEPGDIWTGPWGWAPPIPPIPPTIIESPDGLIIIGGPVRSVLEGGDGNDLIIAGASADHPGNHIPGWGLFILFYSNLAPESWSNRWTDNRDGIYVLGDHLSGGIGRDTLIGNDLENELNGGAGADVMIGGAGSDFYIVDDAGDVVMEHHHGGVDVVLSSISYILSDNVEKLILAANAGDLNGAGNAQDNTLIGNEGRNVLSGGAGNDWLNGASGDDTLIGGEGQDVFYVSELGNSVIADFQVGVDKLAGVFFDLPAMRQDGADTFITWGQGEIRLIGVDMRLLGEQDFWSQADYLFGFPFGFVSN